MSWNGKEVSWYPLWRGEETYEWLPDDMSSINGFTPNITMSQNQFEHWWFMFKQFCCQHHLISLQLKWWEKQIQTEATWVVQTWMDESIEGVHICPWTFSIAFTCASLRTFVSCSWMWILISFFQWNKYFGSTNLEDVNGSVLQSNPYLIVQGWPSSAHLFLWFNGHTFHQSDDT